MDSVYNGTNPGSSQALYQDERTPHNKDKSRSRSSNRRRHSTSHKKPGRSPIINAYNPLVANPDFSLNDKTTFKLWQNFAGPLLKQQPQYEAHMRQSSVGRNGLQTGSWPVGSKRVSTGSIKDKFSPYRMSGGRQRSRGSPSKSRSPKKRII